MALTREHAVWTAALLAGAGALKLYADSRRRQYNFRDRVVFITGGSRGLGLLIARQLADEGAQLAICARSEDELERAAEDLRSRGVSVVTLRCDVADQAAIERAIEETERMLGPVDVLINNAGTIAVGPVDVMDIEDYENAMNIHFWGPLYACRAAIRSMRRHNGGRIVNIASIGSKISVPHLVPYCASKFALYGFSRGLRTEVARDGITVTTVCPGLMRTGSPMNANFKGKHEAEYAWFKISDSMPGLSMNAERAARQAIEACREGRAEVILTLPAVVAAKFDALFPEISSAMLEVANRLLPSAREDGDNSIRKGREAESVLTRRWPSTLSDEAALETNQV